MSERLHSLFGDGVTLRSGEIRSRKGEGIKLISDGGVSMSIGRW